MLSPRSTSQPPSYSFFSVVVGPCISPALVLGVHANLGRVLAGESLWVQALFHCFLSKVDLLPLFEFSQLIILSDIPLLEVILVCLKLDYNVKQFAGLHPELVRVEAFQVERLNPHTQRQLLLLLQLLPSL